ncbi:Alpha-1,3-mannosyltransferase CMT1 [Zancudomyces culisetae]|uniref:Alpha-1,3-mannosyltransferase CMT1 n=1 Tax=Zancudomyces culisetae TaxID=1213189 RepID=A0A1R1PKK2_ZANCU|nr:Alpha-1,3-mannosyltransferase CMT1 [Zancudomyces culisetae]|eukprot:OMH81486.1 Alpha-1,3-mannosyltransferase CMT1 [Zancudomyces culisetae]
MKPFYDLYQKTSHFSIYSDSNQKNKFDKIVFINDVMFCRNDILELILQSYIHGADITCPLDLDFYDETGKNPDEKRFRDTWVARDINGNAFKKTLDKMVSDERGTERMKKYQPFQVQCCWNGIAILNPRPFEAPTNLQFRRSKVPSNECAASECSLLCNDFWRLGYNKVVVVPGVQVAYDTKEFSQLEKYYSNMTRDQIFDTTPIKFQEGPEFVECSPLTKYNFRDPEKFTVSIDYLAQP